MTIANLDFATPGSNPGTASGWAWNRVVPFLLYGFYSSVSVVTRFENFGTGWGCDELVTTLFPTPVLLPAEVVAINYPPYALTSGETIVGTVNTDGPYTATFLAAAAAPIVTSGAPFSLLSGATLEIAFNGGTTISIVFAGGTGITAATVAAEINAVLADLPSLERPNALVSVVSSEVHFASLQEGRGSVASIVGGSAMTALGLTVLNNGGTGNVANIAAVTATEVASAVSTALLATASVLVDALPGVETVTLGSGAALQITGGTANGVIGFPTTLATGTSTPSNATYDLFNLGWGLITNFENFARGWRLPNSGTPGPGEPGTETYLFVLDGPLAALFNSTLYPPGQTIEGFEAGWPSNQVYYRLWASVPQTEALWASAGFETFETGWANVPYYTTMGSTTAATFYTTAGPTEPYEDFSSVKGDKAFTAATTTLIVCPAHGFLANDKITFYNAGDGSLPAGINPAFTYYVITASLTTNEFQFSTQSGGSPASFTDLGSGSNFVKADPSIYWTITNVGV